MSLFGNYNTPGRGVLKAPQEKKGIFKFFEVYGRHMWKLMELNLLYFVFCIPMTLMVILMLMTSNPIWLLLAVPSVSFFYTHLRAHATDSYIVCRPLLDKNNCNIHVP